MHPDNEIVSERVFDCGIETMFKAWTDPEILARWWGPKGFTNTFYEYDLRPGGKWLFTMHGPEIGNYQNECVFEKIEPPALLSWSRISQPLFSVVVHFKEVDAGKTHVIFRMIFPTAAESDKVRKFVPSANEENFDKLENEVR